MNFKSIIIILIICVLLGCKEEDKNEIHSVAEAKSSVTQSVYAVTSEGEEVYKYSLINTKGMQMEVITMGGAIISLTAPDRDGKYEDVVLGYTTPDLYLNGNPSYFGAIIGRYGNRIAKGKFTLEDIDYRLPVNDGVNHLHGGKGFDQKIWKAKIISEDEPSLKLSYTSIDGEEGYPGNLNVTVIYTLTNKNALEISYEADTDKTTIINLTQHSYFNLSGNFKTILDHKLELKADRFLTVDSTLIPTGELRYVAGTPFDFTTAKNIGKDINADNDQLVIGKGYDHCWIFNNTVKHMKEVAGLYHKESGRYMTVYTDQPAIQFYSGNFLDGTLKSKKQGNYEKRSGLCLETQHYPDSPNQKEFPSVVLKAGELYKTKTIYEFSVK